eukprot:27705_2
MRVIEVRSECVCVCVYASNVSEERVCVCVCAYYLNLTNLLVVVILPSRLSHCCFLRRAALPPKRCLRLQSPWRQVLRRLKRQLPWRASGARPYWFGSGSLALPSLPLFVPPASCVF